MNSRERRGHGLRLAPAGALVLAALLGGCATARVAGPCPSVRLAVLTPVDAVPVRDASVWQPAEREELLALLRGDLADGLARAGATVCEDDGDADPRDPAALAARGRLAGADVVVATELVAFGEVRRSWLWLLAGQGLVAGIGHGVAAAAVTGRAATGWWIGLGEFALETVTWVGGAMVASHWLDPVVLRCRAVRVADGAVLGRWTVEGARPVRQWLSADRRARSERLREVADRLLARLAPRIAARCGSAGAVRRGEGS